MIQAARTVTWVLKKEIDDSRPDLRPWYIEKQAEMKAPENDALPWLVKVRNVSTKEGPIEVGTVAKIGKISIGRIRPGEGIVITGRGEPMWTRTSADGYEERRHASEFDSSVASWHFIYKPAPPTSLRIKGLDYFGRDVTDLLTAYITYLRELFAEAERKARRGPG